jgi:tRNA (guanine26-N2/guanine27-N2)-dimethyltransferase
MYMHRDAPDRYDVVDVDPYGSPTDFLDAALQAVDDGGLLCVTCTDMAVLCGNHPEVCHAKYGSVSLKGGFCHEMSLRILIASLESHANRYQRYIVPLVSCSIDFYIRVFVQVFTSPMEVKRSMSKLAMVYCCTGCNDYHLQPLGKKSSDGSKTTFPPSTGPPVSLECSNCQYKFKFGGPIWRDPIHNVEFVKGLLKEVKVNKKDFGTADRITGLLTLIEEELQDVPLFHVVDDMCATLHCTSPSMLVLRSAILNLGYRVSISHTSASALKTDAPHHVLWDIFRCWVKEHEVKKQSATSPSSRILSCEPKMQVCFDIRPDANPPSRLLKLKRFPDNPQANWGPKAKAGRSEDIVQQKKQNQGKRQRTNISPTAKKYPCKRFVEGICTLGDECRYLHNPPASDQSTLSQD